jgi:hypothetical protein
MRLVRLPLAALALIALAACSNDATGPNSATGKRGAPSDPLYTGTVFGSGTRAGDTVHVAATDSLTLTVEPS